MNAKNFFKLLFVFFVIGIVAFSMSHLLKDVMVDHSKSLPQKRVPKGPGYHREPIIDWKDRTMVHLGDFTTNASGLDGRRRFFKTKVSVKASNENVGEELKKRNVVIRDTVIKTLSSRRIDEIGTAEGKVRLKEQIREDINQLIREGEIDEVYFTEFIVH